MNDEGTNPSSNTELIPVDPDHPDPVAIARAAEVIRAGGLVAFPTETVYGLGANALDSVSVGRIFAAKGRPPTNPVIVHVAAVHSARVIVAEWPEAAQQLATRFWPGPLTLVLHKTAAISTIVTAGGQTVAVRIPAHPVALALLRGAGVPVVAPSANSSSRISPTTAQHVLKGLAGRIDMVLDAGRTPGGIESTVLDLTTAPPRLLRPGLIAQAQLEDVIGPIDAGMDQESGETMRSPGQMARHYAPSTPVELIAGDAREQIRALREEGVRIAWLSLGRSALPELHASGLVIELPSDPKGYSAGLYESLHQLDELELDRIVIDLPPDQPEWAAVRDRLRRAAG